MKILIYGIICGFFLVNCTTKKDIQAHQGERSTSSQNNETEDARQIHLWDERTAAGTALGELPEIGTDGSEQDVAEADILGVSSMLQKIGRAHV